MKEFNYKGKSITDVENYINKHPFIAEEKIVEMLKYIKEQEEKNSQFIDKLLASTLYKTACQKLHDLGQAEERIADGRKYTHYPLNKVIDTILAITSSDIGTGGKRGTAAKKKK